MMVEADDQPVAWAVWSPKFGYPFDNAAIFKSNESAVEMCVMNGYGVDDIVPLYRRPLLSYEEREAIEWVSSYGESNHGLWGKHAATLRGLLERLY